MGKFVETYISKEEFETKLANRDLYAGFVIGVGYASFFPQEYYQDVATHAINPTSQNYSLVPSECIIVWIQCLDDSPEMKMRSLKEDPTKWTDFFGSTKLQRFAAQEFAKEHNGEVKEENEFDISVVYSDEYGIEHTQQFHDDGTLRVPGGEINPHESNLWEELQNSNFVGKIVYGVLDDAYVALQCVTIGHANARHLSRTRVIESEAVAAGINTLLTIMPVGNVEKGAKVLNAAQFNSLYKGSLNTASKVGLETLRRNNFSIREAKSAQNVYKWFDISSSYLPYLIDDDSVK